MNFSTKTIMIVVLMNLVVVTWMPAQEFLEHAGASPSATSFVDDALPNEADQNQERFYANAAPMPPENDVYEMAMAADMMYQPMPMGFQNARKVFIIPAREESKESYLAIEQDIHIMAHIFNRLLEKPQMIGGVFTVMDDFFGQGSHVTQIIYLDGYGALFFMEVDLLLTGLPESPKEKDQQQADEHTDEIWKRAEQELYSPQNVRNNRENRSGQEYDAEKVEVLKKDLIEGLKHAANIRALKSDDLVILTVIGRAGKATRNPRRREWTFGDGKWTRTGGQMTSILPAASLVIRAKKVDIDAFSKGELNLDQFSQRTQVFTLTH